MGTTPVAIELANVWPRAKNTLIEEHTTYCPCSTGSGDDVSVSLSYCTGNNDLVREGHVILSWLLTNQITTQ